MLAYRAIDIQTKKSDGEVKMRHCLLEKVLKAFKTNRCTVDTGTKWTTAVVGTMNNPINIE